VPLPTLGEGLKQKREQLVRAHVEAENAADFEAALATFEHPRYEYVATDEVHDGAAEVMAHWKEYERAFPDQFVEIMKLHSSDEAVLMEAVARGTHTGPFRGLPPTGRSYSLPFLAIFVFEGDKLVCERVYLDSGTMLQALGVADDPLSVKGRLGMVTAHPLTIGRGIVRGVTGR
jgi:steroid delta-isomerase-like uncharacterized protein